jgi:hypothetical protein
MILESSSAETQALPCLENSHLTSFLALGRYSNMIQAPFSGFIVCLQGLPVSSRER